MPADPPLSLQGPGVALLRGLGRALLGLPRPLGVGLVVLQASLIWLLSSLTHLGPRESTPLWSVLGNLAHAPLFGFLALFLAAVLLRAPGKEWASFPPFGVVWVVGLVGLYGVLDEWHQARVPGREPSLRDLLTDVVGALCVLWVGAYLGREDCTESGLWARLGVCASTCLASATLAAL